MTDFPHEGVEHPRPMFYERNGDASDPEHVSALLNGEFGERMVAHTAFVTPAGHRYTVSTIFLGIDHAFEGTPQLFETATIEPGGMLNRARHPTEQDARIGHAAAVAELVIALAADDIDSADHRFHGDPLQAAVDAVTSRFPPREDTE